MICLFIAATQLECALICDNTVLCGNTFDVSYNEVEELLPLRTTEDRHTNESREES